MLRLINIGLLISFSFCYMEWGQDMSSFIFQIEYTLLFESKDLLDSLTHPLIIAGTIGQIILLYCAIVRQPNRILNLMGILGLGIIVALVFLAGLLSLQVKMIASTIPYIGLTVLYFLQRRKDVQNE